MNPKDFLDVSWKLIDFKRGRPRPVDLRRAVSTAYYALYHCLAKSNADLLVGRSGLRRAWTQSYRALNHNAAQKRCKNNAMMSLFPPEIRLFADVFCMQQIARNEADYNPLKKFYQYEVSWSIIDAEMAINAFMQADRAHRRAFAIYLLLNQR